MGQVKKRVILILIREINSILFIIRMEMFNLQSKFISKLLKVFAYTLEFFSSKKQIYEET